MKIAVVYNKKTISESDVINVMGMVTKEHYSEKAIERVANALEKGGHNVKLIEGNMQAINEMREFMPKVLSGERPGMVFNMAYGIQGQNRYTHVPAMLEMLGVPYVGSGPEAHAVVQDKVMTKIVLQKHNLPTPKFWLFTTPDDEFDDMEFPVIVKPKLESTSMGMKVVDNWNDLRAAVAEQIEKFEQEILVEQFISGREFAVGILGNGSNLQILPIVEIDLKDPNKIQDISDKLKKGGIDKVCPAPLSEAKTKELQELCSLAYKRLGIYDYSRVDVRMDAEGNFYILELNSMASLGMGGSLYYAAKTAGYTYEGMINKILDVAAERYFGQSLASNEQHEEVNKKRPLKVILRSYLRSHQTTIEKFLEQLVNINSSVTNTDEINKIGNLLSKRLLHLRFKPEIHHEFDVGNHLYLQNHDSEENDVLLLSHLDTSYTNRDFSRYARDGNKLFGSGISDSKSGLAVLVASLQALRFARNLKRIKVGILLTTDDSLGGKHAKKLVEDYSKKSKFVIDLKCGNSDGGIATSCSGYTRYHIDMSHMHDRSGIKDVIPNMCKKVIDWKKMSHKLTDARTLIYNFSCTTSLGRSPDFGRLELESRYRDDEQGKLLDKKLRDIAKKKEEVKLDVHVHRDVTRPPVLSNKDTEKFYGEVEKLAKSAEIKIKPYHRYITSDLSYVPVNIPTLGSMGPLAENIGTANEYIQRDSIIDRSILLALTINHCSKSA